MEGAVLGLTEMLISAVTSPRTGRAKNAFAQWDEASLRAFEPSGESGIGLQLNNDEAFERDNRLGRAHLQVLGRFQYWNRDATLFSSDADRLVLEFPDGSFVSVPRLLESGRLD